MRRSWRGVIAGSAVAAAAAAVWVTLDADFLAYPGWLAAQKADFVLGPALAGLYWMLRRPQSRFGPMLIAWSLVGALYILQSSGDSWLFTIGLFWEKVFGLGFYVLILAFPTGRLDRPSRIVLAVGVVVVLLSSTAIQLLLPQVGAGGSISSCRSLCPRNELSITSDPALASDLFKGFSYAVLALALATAALVVHRFVTGTPPRRRALAIGTPVALLFLLCEALFQLLNILGAQDTGLYGIVIWVFVAARAAVWYGFLFALIAAELFAARAMQRLTRQSLRRPSRRELETMLREPLGDPQLRLAFWNARTGTWTGAADEHSLQRPEPPSGLDVTVVEHDGTAAVSILHDAELNDDPELLQTAAAVALLAAENAELDAGWVDALQQLRESRARLVRAGDAERRKIERNLHDGVQQHLVAIRIDLGIASDSAAAADAGMRARLEEIGDSVEEALNELRDVAHGLDPPALSDWGLVAALEHIQRQVRAPLTVHVDGIGRHPPELESAVYYCCLEAIQNASKHGGPAVQITATLRQHANELTFHITDDGPGFDPSRAYAGIGLQNMRDRVSALDGHLTIVSAANKGTTVAGSVPLHAAGISPPGKPGWDEPSDDDQSSQAGSTRA